ncbi:MAG: DUF4258 domain-containing protein [Ginsengibacter sp.]
MKKNLRLWILLLTVVIFVIIKLPEWRGSQVSVRDNNAAYRNTADLILTKHVRCRMDCRDVTLEEIKEIIENGKVNFQKSGIGKKGDSTFALEGISSDKQHLRVVVAPEKNGSLVVITCIDLKKEWPCDCN